MSQRPQTWGGGTNSYKVGELKRRLDGVIIVQFTAGEGVDQPDAFISRLVLKNLSGDLNVQIAGAFGSPDSSGQFFGTDLQVQAGSATMQLTPVINTTNAGKLFLRPVFQDPTAAQNENHPLPQDLPFGWEFSTEADEVYIDIAIDPTLFVGLNFDGSLIVYVTIEYNGNWWDTDAISRAVGQVQLTNSTPILVSTEGG